jgi:hypothetical protein
MKMPMRFSEKIDRVIRFVSGLRNPSIAERLSHHGFSQRDLDEGWDLIKKAVGDRVDTPDVEKPSPDTLEQLDAWENKWFPVARATLERRYPDSAKDVFLNLAQSEGIAVTLSVATFLRRLDELKTSNAEARAVLGRRGLTASELENAKKMLDELGRIGEQPAIDLEARERQFAEAEDALWAWYLEWSAIARVSIENRRLLRQLGFLSVSRDEPEVDEG